MKSTTKAIEVLAILLCFLEFTRISATTALHSPTTPAISFPFQLNHVQNVVHWVAAQKALGLPITAHSHRSWVGKWHNHTRGLGSYSFGVEARSAESGSSAETPRAVVIYVMLSKAGSEEIAENLGTVSKAAMGTGGSWTPLSLSITTGKPCFVTFVRNPLTRWISGYAEFEWRFTKNLRRFEPEKGLTFTRFNPGDTRRAQAFIIDLVSFAALQSTFSLNPEQKEETLHPTALAYRNAILHVYPMIGQLRRFSFNFVGSLENFDSGWNGNSSSASDLASACGLKPLPPFVRNPTVHPTSADPQGARQAMSELLSVDCGALTAVCHLIYSDFEALYPLFGYECPRCYHDVASSVETESSIT